MGSVQGTLQVNIPALFSALQLQAPGSKAGLVGYGSGVVDIRRLVPLTSNQTEFDVAAGKLVADGAIEPGYSTIIEAVNAGGDFVMNFDKKVGFCVAILTDDQSNTDCQSCTLEAAINAMLNVGPTPNEANAKGVLFGIVDQSWTGPTDSYGPIANATGGAILSLDDFVLDTKPVLDALAAKCSFFLNQITLSPETANVPAGQTHTLTVATNQLSSRGALIPQGGVPVTLVVVGAAAAPPLRFSGKTKADGTVNVVYNPYKDPAFRGATVEFKACRTDVSPKACDTASAIFRPGRAVTFAPSSKPSSLTSAMMSGKGMMKGKGVMHGNPSSLPSKSKRLVMMSSKGMMNGKGVIRGKPSSLPSKSKRPVMMSGKGMMKGKGVVARE